MTYTIYWITNAEEFKTLYTEWEALFVNCIKPDPFLHPRWVKVWWTHFSKSAELCLMCIRKNGVLVGIAPLMRQRVYWRFLPVREIRGFNNGQSVRPGLLLTTQADELMPLLVQSMLEQKDQKWDVWYLSGLDEAQSKALLNVIKSNLRLRMVENKRFFHSYLSLEGNWSDYLSNKTANFRRSLHRSDNLLGRQGIVRSHMYQNQNELLDAVELFFELDSRSWKRDKGEWLLNDCNLADYYRNLISEFAEIGACGIYLLSLDGRVIGGVLCLFMHNIIYTLKTSFDNDYAKFSPGTVMFHYLIKTAFTSGFSAIDFLAKTPFTNRWTENDQCFQDVMIMNTKPYSLTLAGISKIKHMCRDK